MREALAEQLLAQVMRWSRENVAAERPLLQAMAALKYDEYQQYAPGMRFVESLALWLRQFVTQEERQTAYEFVKSRLVFVSSAEMAHLVSIAYPDHIRPLLIRQAAETCGVSDTFVARIANSKEYRTLRRQCLFLGLSDGARIDTFRRATYTELSHEQIWQTYEMSAEKAIGMIAKLRDDLAPIVGSAPDSGQSVFRMVFLLDDFSGSGRSYLMKEGAADAFDGKIARFKRRLTGTDTGMHKLVSTENLYIGIVLYIGTSRARDYLGPLLGELFKDVPGVTYGIHIVHTLGDLVRLNAPGDAGFWQLTDRYYDPNAENEHTRKGGTDMKRGFAGCALPVVLSHNTPNNSVFLLWANPDEHTIRGLFPRVSRHRSDP